jgi:F0F1-type ATP synthase assembly protein I
MEKNDQLDPADVLICIGGTLVAIGFIGIVITMLAAAFAISIPLGFLVTLLLGFVIGCVGSILTT